MKLVYRTLRKISDWTVGGFYSDVYIDGQGNVPKDGPLIIASTHHNEIIDIALLSVTIPHRRHLSFWAKDTLFINPISRAILTSSGSIPVHRNSKTSSSQVGAIGASTELFRATSAALAKGAVVGVFPEGTSYTAPRIMQVKDGAAKAAMEYARWARVEGSQGQGTQEALVLVPVGIVYADKSQYRSRVLVRYGKPIEIQSFTENFLSVSEDEVSSRTVVQQITSEIEEAMVNLTINSTDWDTQYAARITRAMLWGDEDSLRLQDFAEVSQILVDIFSPTSTSPPHPLVKDTLIKYYSLLHYTSMTHSTLTSVYPPPPLRSGDIISQTAPSLTSAFVRFFIVLSSTILHPRFLLFLPTFLCHTPAYLAGYLAARFLVPPDQEESQAQIKAVFAGIGLGLGFASVTRNVVLWLTSIASGGVRMVWARQVGIEGVLRRCGLEDPVKSLGKVLSGGDGSFGGKLKRVLVIAGVYYVTAWTLFRWHNALVDENYRQLKRLIASYKILAGLLTSPLSDIQDAELQRLSRPPRPSVNLFIRRSSQVDSPKYSAGAEETENVEAKDNVKVTNPSSRKLIRHLLAARAEAALALRQYLTKLSHTDGKEAVDSLKLRGARLN